MNSKLLKIIIRLFEQQFIDLFRHIYAIKENGEIIGYVGMDGSFISIEKPKRIYPETKSIIKDNFQSAYSPHFKRRIYMNFLLFLNMLLLGVTPGMG